MLFRNHIGLLRKVFETASSRPCYTQSEVRSSQSAVHNQDSLPSAVLILTETSSLRKLACEQALCLGKKIARKGKGRGERACRHTFEAAIPPSCNYLAEHLSTRSLSVNQFRA